MSQGEKSAYKSLDNDAINEKITGSMLVAALVVSPDPAESAEMIFNHIKESYSVDELAFIAATYVGAKLKEALEDNPRLISLVKMMRQAEDLSKRMNQDG